MKKFCFFLLSALLCLAAGEASAFTLNVEIDDASRISEITTYPDQSVAVDYSSGKCQLTFPDDAFMRYVYITPVKGKYITSWQLYDEDENLVNSKKEAKGSRIFISIDATADYGTLKVSTSDELVADAKVTVNLTGDPSKVQFSFAGRRTVELKEGVNELPYFDGQESNIYVLPQGVARLYQVCCNGTDVQPISVADEGGNISYQYHFYQDNGDVIDIVTDFPDVYYNCTISLPEGDKDIVAAVTVDGQPVDDWSTLSVHGGSNLVVTTNRDYTVSSFTVNGTEMVYYDEWSNRNIWSHEWSRPVVEDLNIVITGKPIERNSVLTIQTHGWDALKNFADAGTSPRGNYYRFERSDGKMMPLPEGESTLNFYEQDNPFSFVAFSYDDDTAQLPVVVMLNGEEVMLSWGYCSFTFNDGDVLKLYYDCTPDDDGIADVKGAGNGDLFNLHGIKMAAGSNLPAGLYIQSGKKVLVK